MTALFAPAARLPEAWASNVRFDVGADGVIEAVTAGADQNGAEVLEGPVIPGIPNLHSHAFQRAMAGLAERRHGDDDFWSWREAMYRFLSVLSPSDVEIIATQLYVEMVKAGYTRVCEFHYLHNERTGARYSEPAVMARAHLRAARTAGIGMTLVPTLYAHGGCGGKPLKDSQKRFAITPEQLAGMVQALEEETAHVPGAHVAVGIHSLRAADIPEIEKVIAALPYRAMHIHVSEQMKEVEECRAWCGQTPIAQLDRTIGLGEQWNLVHATHATAEEIERITEAGATVTLCPSTEGNLGDGLFPADDFFRKGGVFGIGSDSQICTDPREELRLFEYGRRLKAGKRALSADKATPNSGAWLWLRAAEGGERPSAAPVGKLAKDYRADMLVLNGNAPSLLGREGDTLLDAFVFATQGSPAIRDVIVGGKRVVEFGHHHAEEQAEEQFRRAWEKWKTA
ncbi:MAG: formimidoylglutamate deiminase [Alphaproteobacteria bacterium]